MNDNEALLEDFDHHLRFTDRLGEKTALAYRTDILLFARFLGDRPLTKATPDRHRQLLGIAQQRTIPPLIGIAAAVLPAAFLPPSA